jgi:hypothetical protein
MQAVKTYLYPNRIEVQILDTSIYHLRKRTVYSRTIKIYKGVDNPIQIVVNNQDNKPVPLTDLSVRVDVQDPLNEVSVYNTTVSITDSSKGLGIFTLDKSLLDRLDQRRYKLTFRTTNLSNSAEQPMYSDDNYGVPVELEVLPAYYPDA